MKKISLILLVSLLLISGCATPQATRQAQFLSDSYNEQVEKDIFVISLIDARADKEKDLQELLSNKPTFDFFVMNPLKAKGYIPKFIKVDTSSFNSLSAINQISEITSLDKKIFENGNLFLFISIDQYTAPQGMRVAGNTKVTGALYSKSADAFIWKDAIEGNYAGSGIAYGPAAYLGMLAIKGLSSDCLFRNNVFNAINALLDSVPPFSRKNR